MATKRRADQQLFEGVETHRRRLLRSSFNDENVAPEILQDANECEDELVDPRTPSKRLKRTPAKHAGGVHRAAFSPVKVNGGHTPSKLTKTLAKTQLATPQTPRHRDALSKFETPRHRVQAAAKLPLTPRTPQTPSGSTSVYNTARQLFARGAASGELIGRERERAELESFLEGGITAKSGRCLYISGPPGTGKSAYVGQVCNGLKNREGVQSAYLNCMSIKNSKELVSSLIRELSGQEPENNRDGLNILKSLAFPAKECNTIYVLTMDEVDHILTLDLEVLYTLFEWALNPESRLILVGIANALDLTDRFLPRLKSRNLKPKLLPFVPYTVPQIASVIITRLKTLSSDGIYVPFIHPTAVQFCAKKVASQTGDLRKAFDLARSAIDVIEAEAKKAHQSLGSPLSENKNLSSAPVPRGNKQDPLAHLTPETAPRATIAHVARIAASTFNNGSSQRLKTLNLQQKAALCSLVALEKKNAALKRDLMFSTPSKSASQIPNLRKLFDMYSGLCKQEGKLAPLERNEFGEVVGSLEGLGLVRIAETKGPSRGLPEEKGFVSAVSEKEVEGCLEGVVGGLLMGLLKSNE